MRQRFLQGQALLEDVAVANAVEELAGKLPSGLSAVAGVVQKRTFALLVVVADRRNPLAMVLEGIAVGRQDVIDVELLDAGEGLQVIVERIGPGLWVEADVRADLRQ